MVSFLELTKAMLYYKTIDLNIKSKNFYDYLLACEYHNLLPKNSAIVIETLRKLRMMIHMAMIYLSLKKCMS